MTVLNIKNKLFLLLIVFAISPFFTFSQSAVTDACDWEAVKQGAKKELKPFQYYAFKITKVVFGEVEDQKEVEVPLFMDAEYKFVFNTSGIPQKVKIQVFDKPMGNPGRKLLFEQESINDQFSYEPPKGTVKNRVYINYIIPKSNVAGTIQRGCILFYSGTKGTF